jgi:hypothetical protein
MPSPSDRYPVKRPGSLPRTAPIRPTNVVTPTSPGVRPYGLAGGWADVRGFGPMPGVQPRIEPPAYQPGSMRLPGGYGVMPQVGGAAAPAATSGAPSASPGEYPLGRSPTPQRTTDFVRSRQMAGSGFRPAPPAPAPAGPSGAQKISNYLTMKSLRGRGVAPQIGSLAPPSPAAPAVPAGPSVSGGHAWNTLMHPGPPSGQTVWSALHPTTPAATATPQAPTAAPAGNVAATSARATLGSRIGSIASRGGNFLKGAAIPTLVGMASDNPEEGFMHLGQGDFRNGARRLMTSTGHMLAGSPQPGDVTASELWNAAYRHSWPGDMLNGAINIAAHPIGSAQRVGGKLNDMRVGLGNAIAQLGEHVFGDGGSEPAPASPETPPEPPGIRVPSQWSAIAQHGNADQLNSLYEHLGIGGRNPAQAAPAASPGPPSAIPGAMPRGTAVYRGGAPGTYEGFGVPTRQHDAADYALQNAMTIASGGGDYDSLAALGHALANYRGQLGSTNAGMLSAQANLLGTRAELERASNPLAGYMNPIGINVLDQHLGAGGQLIGTAQAHGIGLGPGGRLNPAGLPAYAAARFPEFSPLLGGNEWSVDQARDIYNRMRGRFGEGDSQLSDLDSFVRQLLQSHFTPDELDASATPGWFGSRSEANNTRSFLGNLGLGAR